MDRSSGIVAAKPGMVDLAGRAPRSLRIDDPAVSKTNSPHRASWVLLWFIRTIAGPRKQPAM
jgi:hypothetical protein